MDMSGKRLFAVTITALAPAIAVAPNRANVTRETAGRDHPEQPFEGNTVYEIV